MSNSINECMFSGHLTRDPKIKRSQQGNTFTNFSIAVNNRRFDNAAEQWINTTVFVDFIAFGNIARRIVNECHRGTKVSIASSLEQTMYIDKNGRKRTSMIFKVNDIEIREEPGKWHAKEWF